jgi:hypothetical protein
VVAMALTALTATVWLLARGVNVRYPLGIEPIFPALAVSLALWLFGRDRKAAGAASVL